MDPQFSVRRAEEADAAALVELRRAIFDETEFMLWEPGEFRDGADDELVRIRRLNGARNSACFVAVDGGGLVAFLNAMGGPVNRLRHATSLALGVRQTHWGRGIGSALLEEARRWSRAEGLARVELTVHTSNARAVALYRRAGFEVEGVRRKSLLLGDRFVDEYLMSLVSEASPPAR